MTGSVEGLQRSADHGFSKQTVRSAEMVAGVGLVGDAHAGARVKHRSRVRANPEQPNLRQVHLLQAELFDELAGAGHVVRPGDLGENVTTRGIDLLSLPTGAMLRLGDEVLLALTGLRNPCGQIEAFQPGLLDRVRTRGEQGRDQGRGLVRRAGVMAVVVRGGRVTVGDAIEVALPPGDPIALALV